MNNLRTIRLFNNPKDDGIVPTKEFHCKDNDCSGIIRPIPEGIVPVKLLYDKCISFNVVTSEREEGKVPVRRLA